ncbi:MAG TPA: (d)CMP kinase [Opitutae bacterium]|nr:(d)CMP kinase [Opitutae bacterium]|tara:strand:+ start:2700 stop:3383 length:684 start_codon:yes stop_codon:yes gene_type:complete
MTSQDFIIIAIDGGAASGKSTTARALSEKYKLLHVDTGSHYRALTQALLNAGLESASESQVQNYLSKLNLDVDIEKRTAHIVLNDKRLNYSELRSPKINETVSYFAAMPSVRSYLLNYQRNQAHIAKEHNFSGLIMEGRDIGSVIFPSATLRLFFYADEATRASRRQKDGEQDAIAQRDKLDSQRKAAPLTCPEGAIQVDTSSKSIDEVIQAMSILIEDALKNAVHP